MKNIEVGTWSEIPSPYVTHIISKAGLDFIILDMEHGVLNFELIQNMIFAAHSENCKIFVRVPFIDESYTLRALDTGADGIVFPQVTCKKDVERIVEYSKFFPCGSRGFNPFISACGYKNVDIDFLQKENERVKIAVILEGIEAFSNIEEILQNIFIDIIYIGQYDLSVALGIPGEINHIKVIEVMKNAIEKIKLHKKHIGCMVHDVQEAKKMINMGFDFIVYGVDSGVLFKTYNKFVKGLD